MSAQCGEHDIPPARQIADLGRYRKIFWVALRVNAGMFLIEVMAGFRPGSNSARAGRPMRPLPMS